MNEIMSIRSTSIWLNANVVQLCVWVKPSKLFLWACSALHQPSSWNSQLCFFPFSNFEQCLPSFIEWRCPIKDGGSTWSKGRRSVLVLHLKHELWCFLTQKLPAVDRQEDQVHLYCTINTKYTAFWRTEVTYCKWTLGLV